MEAVTKAVDGPSRLLTNAELVSRPLAAFPPRNEPLAFRQQLEEYYRTTLRRTPIQTAVDLEGGIVWTQEYLRYRLSGCDHVSAVNRVLSQIDGTNPSECGGSVNFPPRNEALDFRSNYLESKYRNGLRRALGSSYVDMEGDVIWTMEYFRYRLSGCDHSSATQKTLAEVGGAAAPATCQTLFTVWTSANQGWNSIAVTINGRSAGTLTRYLEPDSPPSCSPSDASRITMEVPPGTVVVSARSDRGATWNYSSTAVVGQCSTFQLTCTNRNCGPTTRLPPITTPTIPTVPTTNSPFHVFGGPNFDQYLGYFSCTSCQEFGSDSINNEFGRYGSPYSATSIRNQFSQYGSPYSTYSACNEFASSPPRVVSQTGVFLGELTLNQYRSNAIRTTSIVMWLRALCP